MYRPRGPVPPDRQAFDYSRERDARRRQPVAIGTRRPLSPEQMQPSPAWADDQAIIALWRAIVEEAEQTDKQDSDLALAHLTLDELHEERHRTDGKRNGERMRVLMGALARLGLGPCSRIDMGLPL